ncbi:type II toxin-antitoxin system RelE/ParE family toxin [Paraburkholderia sp. C35]|uniref:type II toxin-antitoxin system RelE/ParE family toxin n=1 Tax=Paraburkholderia sp. C35 TaxID=2126993 RepID=UPI000D68547F|nr:type II toxin-antitoxin system RelE/ParE family toxin [Paraburkholderia sp. C35]
MKEFVLSPAAGLDLDDIWDYSAKYWGIRPAERYIRMIQDTIVGLTDGTQPSRAASHVRQGYRSVLVGTHIVFFKETEILIDVIRILHQRMNPFQHLSEH